MKTTVISILVQFINSVPVAWNTICPMIGNRAILDINVYVNVWHIMLEDSAYPLVVKRVYNTVVITYPDGTMVKSIAHNLA